MDSLAPTLQALVALVESDGHMTDAAAELGIPQSSMSRRVHALEEALGLALVVREGRGLRLTPGARRLAADVAGPLRAIGEAAASVAAEADPEHGTVRFGFPLSMGAGLVPTLLAGFRREHPGVHLELRQSHGADLAEHLRAGTLDCAIVIPSARGVTTRALGRQAIRVHLPPDHPLAGRERIELAALRDEAFIAPPPSFHLRQATESWCREAGFEPAVTVEIPELLTIRGLVAGGLGVALLPDLGEPSPPVVARDLATPLSRPVTLAWGPTGHTPVAQALISATLTTAREAPAREGQSAETSL